MGRIRTIKPEFFKHAGLYDLELDTGLPMRLAYAGLWTQCDREGRFPWRVRALKFDILPYDQVDFSRVLDLLAADGLIVKYRADGRDFGYIPTWKRHQSINNRETASVIPPPPQGIEYQELDASATREARDDDAMGTRLKGKGREGKGREKEEEPASAGSSEPSKSASEQNDDPAVLEFPTVGKSKTWTLCRSLVFKLAECFPDLDVLGECRKALAWCETNKANRKTADGMPKFLNGWITRAQNGGSHGRRSQTAGPASTPARPRKSNYEYRPPEGIDA